MKVQKDGFQCFESRRRYDLIVTPVLAGFYGDMTPAINVNNCSFSGFVQADDQ